MENHAQDIVNLIIAYTSELEALDQLNNTYLMTCIGVIGAILGIIATAYNVEKKSWKTPLYRMVPFLFLSIPVISCAFLGVVTLNCRKVAMYRSYLVYLETAYNQIDGTLSQYFNSNTQQFISKWWFSNPNGSIMNRIVDIAFIFILLILLIICFILANKTHKNVIANKGYGSQSLKRSFRVVFIIVLLVCIIVCAASCYDLLLNGVTVDKVLYELNSLQ